MSASRLFTVVRALVVAALVTSSPHTALAQEPTLVVRVIDPTGASVANATVVVSTRDARVQVHARTDLSGTARVRADRHDHILQIAADGFVPITRTVTASQQESPIEIALTLAGITDSVVVTASGELQAVYEVAKAVSVVDAREIEVRQEFSVADALRTVPGATVQQLGGPGSFTSIKLRGLREQDTAVLIDGVRLRDAGAPQGDATGFVGELYLTNLDRVEVLRGSASSLYGSHAVGGAVNLITLSGAGRPAADLSIEAGGLGFARATAHGGGSAGNRVSFSLGAGHTRTTRGVDGDDRALNTSVQGRGDIRMTDTARATVRVYASDADAAINESPGAIGPLPQTGFVPAHPLTTFTPSLNDPDNTRASRLTSTLVRLDQRASSRFGYSASFHHLTTARAYLDGPLGVSAFEPQGETRSDFDGTMDTVDTRADLEWTARHVTTVAYELERERFFSRSLPVNRSSAWQAEIVQKSHSVMVQQQWRMPAMQVAASARAQRFSLDRPSFDPAERAPFSAAEFPVPPAAVTADVAAARWIASTGTTLRAHAGNAYRAPAMYERAGSSFGSRGYTVYGDPRLPPERSVSVDAGVDQGLGAGRARVSATWFRSRLRRVIAFGSVDRAGDPFGRSSGYITADGRVSRGVELSIRAELARGLQANASYTFADAAAPAGNRDGLPRAAAVPAHQFSLLVVQRVRALHVSFELEAASHHYLTLFDPISFGSRAYEFDGVVKADLAASCRLPGHWRRIRLLGIVDNLLDRQYFVQGFRTPGRTGRAGVSLTF